MEAKKNKDMQVTERISEAIRAYMGMRKKTVKELAALLGVTAQQASNLRNGKTPLKVDQLAKVAVWLDVPITTLWVGIEQPE